MKTVCCKALMALALVVGVSSAARADFAAIAYSTETGNWGYSFGQGYLSDAQNVAIDRCNASDAKVVVWVENGWAALAVGDNGAYGWGWSGNSRAEAETIALQKAGANARIRCWVYSGD